MERLNEYKRIDAFTLKSIACISMLIDHIGASLLPKLRILRYIGRLAFPIYCFLLVEGYFHTKDIKKYLGRLFIFALISEIPFDMAFYNGYFKLSHQNVYFTLFFGLLTIYFLEKRFADLDIPDLVYQIIVIAIGCVFAELLNTDYGMEGVLIILIFYFARQKAAWIRNICAEILFVSMGMIEAFAGIALIPIYFYSGEQGRYNKLIKYAFYLFYPVHLLILGLIHMAIY